MNRSIPAVILIASGRASTPAPVDAVAASTAAIAQAERSGASTLAPVEMEAARVKLFRVNRAMVGKGYRRAL